MQMSLITISEYADLTNTTVASITADHSVTYVNNIIDVVSSRVIDYCLGTVFEPTTYTDERNTGYVRGRPPNQAKLIVRLQHAPIISVSSIKYRVANVDTTMSTNNLDYDAEQAILKMWWYGPIRRLSEPWVILTSYKAGYSSVPNMVKMATALLVQEWIDDDDRVSVGGAAGILTEYRIGNYGEKYSLQAKQGVIGLGTSYSLKATDLLRKYRRIGVV